MGARTVTSAAVILSVYLLALPPGLAAKGRRGAPIILSKVDGTEVKVESVRPFAGLTGPAADESRNGLGARSREGLPKEAAGRPGP